MSEAALEEVSVLSSIYCGEGEFQLIQQSAVLQFADGPCSLVSQPAQDGLVVQINCTGVGDRGLDVRLVFHLHPDYPSSPPHISISSTGLSRTQCHSIRQKLQDRAAALVPEPMVHQLVECSQQQCVEVTEDGRGGDEAVEESEKDEWAAVLLLDHIRSRNRYIGLLERWSHQLQLTGRILLGQSILVILQGSKPDIKEFCRRLKTVKVDVDSTGRKCKERMMKILIETSWSFSRQHCLQGFLVKNYQSLSELPAAFEELHMTELYQQILPLLSD